MKKNEKREPRFSRLRAAKILPLFCILCLCLAGACVTGWLERTVYAEDSSLHVRFLSADGKRILEEREVTPGGTVKLPEAPGTSYSGSIKVYGVPSWKPVKGSAQSAVLFDSGQTLSYAAVKDWVNEFGDGTTLSLYTTKACLIQYCKYDGTPLSARDYVYEGTAYTYRSSPNAKNSCYKGWTATRNGTEVDFAFQENGTIWEAQRIYLVTYFKVQFRNNDGRRNSALDQLAVEVSPGTTITIPDANSIARYKNMGWTTTKSSSKIAYAVGAKCVVKSDMVLYAVRKYQPYLIKFTDNRGTSTSTAYKKLYQYAYKSQWITMPTPPAVNGYTALGWAASPKQTTATVQAGEKVRIYGSTTYYAVYKKAAKYTVQFVQKDGSTNSTYKKLNRTVYEGTVITLPAIPETSGYVSKGWRVSVNGVISTHQPGTKYKITGKTRFYSYQTPAANLILYNAAGKVSRNLVLEKGSSYTLPSYQNPDGQTFLGWSKTPRQKASHSIPVKVSYEAGASIRVNGTIRLYPVLADRASEGSLSLGNLVSMTKAIQNKYSDLILVGDSRTVRLGQTLNSMGFFETEIGSHIHTVAEYGQGINWFRNSGYASLLNQIREIREQGEEGTIAIVFNLGVNDLGSYGSYLTYFNQIGEQLTGLNCKLYYMSVNPINSAQMKWALNNGRSNVPVKSERSVRAFNRALQGGLTASYTWIDTYSWLMSTGYSTDKGYNLPSGQNMGVDDGLHYTINTYKWIYYRVLQMVQN